MKKYLILTVAAAMVLSLALPALAQREARERTGSGQGRFQNLSEEERAKLRERMSGMSQEEREQFRRQMRDRLSTSRPGVGREGQMRMAERFEAQIAELKQKHQETVGELKAIRELAIKEKAEKTAARLDKLIAKHEEKFEKDMAQLEQRRQRIERMMSGRETDRPGPPGRKRPERPDAGRPAPPFTLNSFDGKTVSLEDYRGKTVVLEWLNFECPFSLYHHKTVKTMANLANKYKRNNVVWLAVNSTSHTTPEANKEFAKKQKLPYPILDDRPGKVGHAYGAQTTPHMYIINPRGRIVYEGAIDNSPNGRTPAGQEMTNYVDKALAELTAGKVVTTAKSKPYGCTVKYP